MIKQFLNNFFKLNKTILAFTFIILISLTSVKAYAQKGFDVRVIIDGKWKAFNVNSEISVKDLLKFNEIKLNEKDVVSKPLDYVINSDLQIYIETADNITFNIENEEPKNFLTNADTLAVAVEEFEKETGRKFKLKEGQSPARNIKKNMVVYLIPYVEKTSTKIETIPFKTIYIDNNELPLGSENIKVSGVEGSKELKFKDTYAGDELISSTNVSEKVIQPAINQIIEKGTKVDTIKKEVTTSKIENKFNQFQIPKLGLPYSKKLSMKSTAYTANYESTGKNPGDKGYGLTASGMQAKKGVVAVDTNVIPFGTKLYIEGYGNAIAGDTGGSIKGDKIDVFMPTYKEAINWGVRYVDVYILK